MTLRKQELEHLGNAQKELAKFRLKRLLATGAWMILGGLCFGRAVNSSALAGKAEMGTQTLDFVKDNVLPRVKFADEVKTETDKGDGA